MKSLWMRPVHTDVTLIAGNCSFSAHRCLLAAASPAFHRLFSMELVQELTPRSSSESSMVLEKLFNRFVQVFSLIIFFINPS